MEPSKTLWSVNRPSPKRVSIDDSYRDTQSSAAFSGRVYALLHGGVYIYIYIYIYVYIQSRRRESAMAIRLLAQMRACTRASVYGRKYAIQHRPVMEGRK